MMNVLRLPGAITDTSIPILQADDYLRGGQGGVLFLFDLDYEPSYAGGAPTDGVTIGDISGNADSTFELTSGQTVAYSGRGFDFTGVTADGDYVAIPASVAADIWAGNQYFLVMFYVRLPIEADWNTISTLAPFAAWTSVANGYPGEADLLTIAQLDAGTGPRLTARRQTNGASTAEAFNITPETSDFGQFAQILFWRDASGQGFRLKTASNTHLETKAVGSANTGNFSTKVGRLGIGESFWQLSNAAHLEAAKWVLYRGMVENLETSGRDPETVADDDWDRTVARGVFG